MIIDSFHLALVRAAGEAREDVFYYIPHHTEEDISLEALRQCIRTKLVARYFRNERGTYYLLSSNGRVLYRDLDKFEDAGNAPVDEWYDLDEIKIRANAIAKRWILQ